MRPPRAFRCLAIAAAIIGCGLTVATKGAPTHPDADVLVADVGARLLAYYHRAQRLICLERSTVVPVSSDWTIQGSGRTVESELHVELEAIDGGGLAEPRVTRIIRRINGREPRDRDRKDRSGCTDPTPVSPEQLAFLLPGHREQYRFTTVREGKDHGRAALTIDFTSALRSSRPELIEDEGGHDDCFDWKGPLAIAGRVWVDAVTHDVLRLDRHIAGPTDVHVPLALERKYHFPSWLTLDRDDLTLRYKEVAFSDPDERMLLPDSLESMTVFRGGLQSIRTVQTFSEYRRFLTESRIIKDR
jgi:hypothetical protein